ncbi:hypothetical protein DICPUDRAFT_98698 [Dictyostelium purpureum]|uniref:Uncharacterized protein n=1 Tax=Dictyostelium purpureum TaxID=5786 RepID=F0ZSS4_DICPU|nr:uncharacterized protein DICPUDRAFT_98698 [Dictyostelium purpureum]EGC32996.1 hypothetical protein DICPUDRAFT_98698 [Dictyostelium purpureum]|eukprot:XP_003290466.1 hypothetical protein DICPUDRAFT_98698 [Dictyostelium purpureum]
MSSQKIVPINYVTIDIKNWDDIPKAVNCSPDVKKAVDSNNMVYTTINVSDAMIKLATVGELLKVANAASNGFPCSVPIISILADYQSLVNDTVNTTSKFVYFSMASLSQHSLALRIVQKYPQKALALLGKTSEKAKEMSDICQKLIDLAKNLVDKSIQALKIATGDQVGVMEKEKENQKLQDELNEKAAVLRSEIEDLKTQVSELKQLAEDAGKEAAEARKFGMILQMVDAVVHPLSLLTGPIVDASHGGSNKSKMDKITGKETPDASQKIKEEKKKYQTQVDEKKRELEKKEGELKKVEAEPESPEKKQKKEKLNNEINEIKNAIKSLGNSLAKVMDEISNEYKEKAAKSNEKEAEYRKLKNQYQDLQRKANADLTENVIKLKLLSDEKNYLEVSIKSLEITIKTMGKVKTIFENTRLFWLQVQNQCKNLIDISNIKDLSEFVDIDEEFQIDYSNQIKKSGLKWLALASINYNAANAITSVKKNFDQIMSNLPGKEEAIQIVNECTGKIQKALEDENKKIDNTKKLIEAQNNNPTQPVSA